MEKNCTRVLYLLHSKIKRCGRSVDPQRGAVTFLSLFSPRTPCTSHTLVEVFERTRLFLILKMQGATPRATWMYSIGLMISFYSLISFQIASKLRRKLLLLPSYISLFAYIYKIVPQIINATYITQFNWLRKRRINRLEKQVVSGLMLTLLIFGMLTLAFNIQPVKADQNAQLLLETDKDIYLLGENAAIILTNIGNETIQIGGYPAWQIYTYPEEEPVYPAIFAWLAWALEPGENDTFTWNQYNQFNDSFCGPGTYVVKDLQGWGSSAYFEIVASELELDMTVSNTTMTIGQEINITLTLRNIGTSAVTIQYTPPLFDVYYCTPHGCFQWSDGKFFIQVVLSLTLEPSEKYTETLQWNLYQYSDGIFYPPEPGTYYLWGICFSAGITTSSPIPVTLVEPAIPATIDVHPPALILSSKGQWITAYIELPEGYDVSDINVSAIKLNNTVSIDLDAPVEIDDYDGDGVQDLMVKFDRAKVESYIYSQGIRYGNVALTITGVMLDAAPFEGTDIILVNYAGDVNNDGIVNLLDAGVVSAHWYPGPPTGSLGYDKTSDFNKDGAVGILDAGILSVNWGQTVP